MSEAGSLVSNFNQLPQSIQGVLVEMAFNLGKSGLGEFKNFLSKISSGRWKDAAAEMLRSDWRAQVGQRAQTLADIVKSATN
jgi:lysozyme